MDIENRENKKAPQSIWVVSLKWLGWNIFGISAPIWFSFLLFCLFSKNYELSFVAGKGELYIYSVSFLVPVIFNISTLKTKAQSNTMRVSVGLLIFDAILYSGIIASGLYGQIINIPLNMNFLYISSFILLGLSICCSYLYKVFDTRQQSLETVEAIRADEYNNLAGKFEKLQNGVK